MLRRACALAALLVLVAVLAACGEDDGEPTASDTSTPSAADELADAQPFEGYVSEVYAGDEHWACRPELADDVCSSDLDATEVGGDGLTVVEHEPASDPAYDCFYVYPTVDYSTEPGNHPFEVANPLEDAAITSQAARFTEQCRLYVPRYRQATIASYREVVDGELYDVPAFETAYADVLDAFAQYMAQDNDGRDFVLMGHSQGSHHLTRLVQEEVDGDAVLEDQLISALLVGPTGQVTVAEGDVVGGTFEHVPLCTDAEQTGCVVAFDSYWEGAPQPDLVVADGEQRACVNPAALLAGAEADATEPASGAYTSAIEPGLTTSFELVGSGFTLTCTEDAGGQPYLEVGVDPDAPRAEALTTFLAERPDVERSLHTSDWAFPMRDLLDLVERQAASTSG